jgi:putative endonuclease
MFSNLPMAEHNITGKVGEQLAVHYLLQNGYNILHKNWRSGHHEVDVIASKCNVLHFIEVKTKTTDKWGFPEDDVTPVKFRFLKRAASSYLFQNPNWQRVQFDVLSIILKPQLKFFLIEDVYM